MGGRTSKIAPSQSVDVFLGGDPCNWREDFIKMLQERNLSFHDPMANMDWSLDNCRVLYFEIGCNTTAQAACIEAAYYIGLGRRVVVSMRPYRETLDNLTIAQDVNRMRRYLYTVAEKHGIAVFDEPCVAVADFIKEILK